MHSSGAANRGGIVPGGKPRLGLVAIGNLSFGFFGIQIAFALQTANISRIFQILGASIDSLPILWIAGPVTGLLVQPVIGYLSDRTWGRLGRRRPYFLAGAVASATALVLLPNSGVLWLAVPAFWLLDLALNVSMEPFRAFVGDMLPDEQRTTGYAVQTIFIGLGAMVASAAPYLLTHVIGLSPIAPPGQLAITDRLAFYIGAGALLAAVLWTIVSTHEYSPTELAAFDAAQRHSGGAACDPCEEVSSAALGPNRNAIVELFGDIRGMPAAMRRLAVIQFFSWCGFFMLWIYGTPVVAAHHFGAAAPGSAAFAAAGEHVGLLFAVYNGVATVHAFLLPWLAGHLGRERLHGLNLLAGAAGFAGFLLTRDPTVLYASMVGIGMAWASVLAMPYALLCGAIPYRKLGTYMGIFNFFIVLPQIVVALVMGWIVRRAFPGDPVGVMAIAAASFTLAAILAWRPLKP
jgi:maltose/moltooligosaccharide transporter